MLSSHETTAEFERLFHEYVHQHLNQNLVLHEAIKYPLLQAGKRLRPLFSLEAGQMASLEKKAAMKCAFAMEIAHTYSLVHDDLPCMDNDDIRRGLPTTHRKFGEPQAVLVGDALHDFAYQTFFECVDLVPHKSFAEAFQFFFHSIGLQGMLLGQFDELSLNNGNLDELMRIQSLKTGKLFQASILCPLLLAGKGPNDKLYRDCQSYAESFGFAFQIADDLEDMVQDQIQNKKNILSHLGRATAVRIATEKLLSSPVAANFSATKLLLSKLK